MKTLRGWSESRCRRVSSGVYEHSGLVEIRLGRSRDCSTHGQECASSAASAGVVLTLVEAVISFLDLDRGLNKLVGWARQRRELLV